MLRIITDTASDITLEEAKELGIEILVISIEFEDGAIDQKSNADFGKFYDKLTTSKNLPTTSQPSIGECTTLFDEIRDKGDEAIVITLSDKISGTYNATQVAKGMVGYDKIDVINSMNAVAGERILVNEALRLREQGFDRAAITEALTKLSYRLRSAACVETLEYLKKGGRIPPALALIGKAIRLKPIVHFDEEGNLTAWAKERGTKNSHNRMIELYLAADVDPEQPIYIGYTSSKEIGEEYVKDVQSKFPSNEVRLVPIGGVIGTHIGPDCVAMTVVTR